MHAAVNSHLSKSEGWTTADTVTTRWSYYVFDIIVFRHCLDGVLQGRCCPKANLRETLL